MFRSGVVLFTSGLAVLGLAFVPVRAAEDSEKPTPERPFNGKSLDGWGLKGTDRTKSRWRVGTATVDDQGHLVYKQGGNELVNALGPGEHGLDIFTLPRYGDVMVELEVMVPRASNSGIYLMGEYEVQVFDSFGKDKLSPGDMGGIYSTAAPKVNAAKKPGEWQKFVIDFRAPRFDANGKKTENARFVKVTLNDQVIHENVEVKGPTGGALSNKEAPDGPLMFQGDHGAVAFRNIKVQQKK